MPNKKGELSAEEADRLAKLLNTKGVTKVCPICKKPSLVLKTTMVLLRLATELDRGYPSVVVMCENCGNTLLFNSGVLSIPGYEEWKDEDFPSQ